MDAPIFDETLWYQAEVKATGALVHDLNGARCIYKNEFILGQAAGWPSDRITRTKTAESKLRMLLTRVQKSLNCFIC